MPLSVVGAVLIAAVVCEIGALHVEALVLALPFGLVASNISKLRWTSDQLALARSLFFGGLGFVGCLFYCLSGELSGFLGCRLPSCAAFVTAGKSLFYEAADCF
jgi:hypothetical protein